MKTLCKKLLNHTLLRYFFSYFLIMFVLLACFSMIIREQLTTQYYRQQKEQMQERLNSLAQQLNEDILYLSQVHTSVNSNAKILLSMYKEEDWYNYQLATELEKYDAASVLISSIIAQKASSETVLSTHIAVTEADGIYQFYFSYNDQADLSFDPAPYLDSRQSQLICVSREDQSMLIYFPATSSSQPYILFYILDTAEISQTLDNLISSETLALALIDANGQMAASANGQLLIPYLEDVPSANGFYQLDSSDSLCVQTGVGNDFSLMALSSNSSLLAQVDAALLKYYQLFLPLSLIGFVLILFALKLTWFPLHKLTKKIAPEANFAQSTLEQLDQSFTRFKEENQKLRSKLDSYRQSMQKALLDSSIGSDTADIDQFFETDAENEIYVIRIHSAQSPLRPSEILSHFLSFFPGEKPCILLEEAACDAVFLLNYTGPEPGKADILMDVLTDYLSGKEGSFAAVSNGSGSPLDIPSLYENAKTAANYWDDSHAIVNYAALHLAPSTLAYPNEKLRELSANLAAKNFAGARAVLTDLFALIDSPSSMQSAFPDFFIRSVLVDILTEIGKSMEESNIKFKDYSDFYFEALYSCRSRAYAAEHQIITQNLYKLLDFYEKSVPSKIVDPDYLRELLETSFCQPDFSISVLADHFHVSIAYMSYLTKKELGMNFVDYLWELRLKRAQELLKNTELSVDEISVKVGYLNPSSFRRKFKQATGITPTQYRTGETEAKP